MLPGGGNYDHQPDQNLEALPNAAWHAADHGRVSHNSEAGYET